MSRYRGRNRLIYTLFIALAAYLSALVGSRADTTVFIAFLTLGWHILANLFCAKIASYRFKASSAKYIEIKNKVIRKIFVRPFAIGGVSTIDDRDKRTNLVGLILNVINILLLVSFEILLFMPKIPCKPHVFDLAIPDGRIGWETLKYELDSLNEIIPAEASRAFALMTLLVFFAFVIIFERQLKAHRQKTERSTAKTPSREPFKETQWYTPLYTALVDMSVRQNNKKHRFWYSREQLEQIECLVKSASENAELKLEGKNNKLVSFKVVDTLNNSIRFRGYFI